MKPGGFKYLEYGLMHIVDILVVSHKSSAIMEGVDKVYSLRKGPDKKRITIIQGGTLGKMLVILTCHMAVVLGSLCQEITMLRRL